MPAGGELLDLLTTADGFDSVAGQGQRLELEHLRRGASIGLDVVDGIVDHQALTAFNGGFDGKRQGDFFSQANDRRFDFHIDDLDFGLAARADDSQCPPVALFDQAAQGVSGDPCAVPVVQRPAFDQVQHPVGVILGDVVEVVGHGFAHVQAGVGLEVVEDVRGECRIGLDGLQPE